MAGEVMQLRRQPLQERCRRGRIRDEACTGPIKIGGLPAVSSQAWWDCPWPAAGKAVRSMWRVSSWKLATPTGMAGVGVGIAAAGRVGSVGVRDAPAGTEGDGLLAVDEISPRASGRARIATAARRATPAPRPTQIVLRPHW